MNNIIRVIVVDDSALVRSVLAQGLSKDPEINVVDVASDPYEARDKILQHRPDVLTLDVEMPRMNGVEFLKRLMPQYPIPVLMVSSLTEHGKQITMAALEAGAVDFVTKPSANHGVGLAGMLEELQHKVKVVSGANVSRWRDPHLGRRHHSHCLVTAARKIIAIGASTGGTEAIRYILDRLPVNSPGIVVVQHMPAGFTKMFAERLNDQCPLLVKEATSGDQILPGQALIAPGDQHMTVIKSGNAYLVDCSPGDKVCGHCPSVEVLFNSVALSAGADAIGIVLTGMGHDGAQGLLAMRQAGAQTLVQDKQTSVVYGMPRVAYEIGAAEKRLPISTIPYEITGYLSESN